jgi:hypothetical protein
MHVPGRKMSLDVQSLNYIPPRLLGFCPPGALRVRASALQRTAPGGHGTWKESGPAHRSLPSEFYSELSFEKLTTFVSGKTP